ncbi:hypothetical protein [Streptomyces sp. 8N706]|uniref:hypothetical protein n=1 Tax=Streptomyces sp. 8N706 TaxID=3457416 RepID=UPI003FD5D7BC
MPESAYAAPEPDDSSAQLSRTLAAAGIPAGTPSRTALRPEPRGARRKAGSELEGVGA